MRYRFVIAWLWGISSAVLQAGDWAPDPSTNVELPRIFRPGRTQSLLPPDPSTNRRSSLFELKTEISFGSDVVIFLSPPTVNEPYFDETPETKETGEPSSIIPVQHEELETLIDPAPAINFPISDPETRPIFEAIPLDGAPREDGRTKPDDEPALLSSRTSLGWIAGSNNRLGMTELDFEPLARTRYDATRPNPIYFDTTFGAKWLSGPNITDLPPQLFNILINVGSTYEVDDRLMIDAMISPGWYTDFSNKGVEAFRLPWHLVSYYKLDNDLRWVLGVTDLARQDIRYLPVVGMIYAPADSDIRLDLVFPKPRIAWRYGQNGQYEHWLYLNGELGGGSWAISRSDRSYDTVTYRDYRLIAGVESKDATGHVSRLEIGWIFDRSVQYRSDIGNYSPQDSLMLRTSYDY